MKERHHYISTTVVSNNLRLSAYDGDDRAWVELKEFELFSADNPRGTKTWDIVGLIDFEEARKWFDDIQEARHDLSFRYKIDNNTWRGFCNCGSFYFDAETIEEVVPKFKEHREEFLAAVAARKQAEAEIDNDKEL